MKATVCFANNRIGSQVHDKIVVPCDDGAITVRELANRAALRYRRIFSKNETTCEIVFLKTWHANAVLDFEDLVKDVIDNNELLVACFNQQQLYQDDADAGVFTEISPTGGDIQKHVGEPPCESQTNVSLRPNIQHTLEHTYSSTDSLELNSILDLKEPGKGRLNGYKCGVCYEMFPDHETFMSHQANHNQMNLLKCPKCPRFFAEQCYLDQHLRAHNRAFRRNKPRYVNCTLCGKVLRSPDNLKRHMLVHTDERPFNCQQCGKAFRAKADLKVHARIHTGERPYWCPVSGCGKAFNDRSSFRRHKMVHTRGRATSKSLPGPTVPVYTAIEISPSEKKSAEKDVESSNIIKFDNVPGTDMRINVQTSREEGTSISENKTTSDINEISSDGQHQNGGVIEVEIGPGDVEDVDYVVIKSGDSSSEPLHSQVYYSIDNIIQCKFCGDVAQNNEAMKQHLLLHNNVVQQTTENINHLSNRLLSNLT